MQMAEILRPALRFTLDRLIDTHRWASRRTPDTAVVEHRVQNTQCCTRPSRLS